MNFTVGNIVKRVYHIIREESKTLKINLAQQRSFQKGKNNEAFCLRLNNYRNVKDRFFEVNKCSEEKQTGL